MYDIGHPLLLTDSHGHWSRVCRARLPLLSFQHPLIHPLSHTHPSLPKLRSTIAVSMPRSTSPASFGPINRYHTLSHLPCPPITMPRESKGRSHRRFSSFLPPSPPFFSPDPNKPNPPLPYLYLLSKRRQQRDQRRFGCTSRVSCSCLWRVDVSAMGLDKWMDGLGMLCWMDRPRTTLPR